MVQATSLYFHIPFCNRRCGYCDFNTFAGMKSLLPEYVKALCQEVKMTAESAEERIPVGTIFFGGGTPSLMTVEQVGQVLDTVRASFDLQVGVEITLEANPGTVNYNYLRDLRLTGVNRLSLGMQSAHPDDLRMLDRQHRHEDLIRTVAWSKEARFKHINLDLIFGIPGQTLDRWQNSLNLALLENVDHFSLYSLSVEEGTPLQRWVNRGLLQLPEEEISAAMYETAMDRLAGAGYQQYEISNWARQDEMDNHCRHNLQYWRFLPYLGFGAGAHGFFAGVRTENSGGIGEYIERMRKASQMAFPAGPAAIRRDVLSIWDQMQEYLMVGFRLTEEGISTRDFKAQFGHAVDEYFQKQVIRLQRQGLLEWHPHDADRLRLTRRGRMFGNQVFTEFVGNRIPADLRETPN